MSKITSYARSQNHGVSDPLSGATVPVSNDHTDGSWTITDIYDRELMINTGNGNLQYRAGADIYTVQASPTSTAIKSITKPMGAWDMSTAAAVDSISVSVDEVFGKQIVGLDAILIPDVGSIYYNNGDIGYPHSMIQYANSCKMPLQMLLRISTLSSTADIILNIETTGAVELNYFRFFADSIDATFAAGGADRGYVTVTYID